MRTLLLTLLCVFPIGAQACSCLGDRDTKSLYNHAAAVVLAEITSTKLVKTTYSDHDIEYIVADIDVIETFKKGDEPITQVADLVLEIGNCSIGLMSGLEYVFFIRNNNEDESDEIGDRERLGTINYVGMCTGSHPVNMYHKNFEKEAQELKDLAQ